MELQKAYPAFQAEGAEIIAVSTDDQPAAKNAENRSQASFPVLSDDSGKITNAYNVVDPLRKLGARPATYIIDNSGVVQWKFLDIRVGNRVPTSTILNALRKL